MYFRDRSLANYCLGWPQTSIFLISASQGTRITGVSHQHPALDVMICVSFMAKNAEHFFMCLLAIYTSFENY
jgi:hypothetical protein